LQTAHHKPKGGCLGPQTPVLFNKDLRCAKHCGEERPVLKNIFFYKLIKQVSILNSFLIHQENWRASHKRSKPQIQRMLFSFCQSELARGVNKPAQYSSGLDPCPILAQKFPCRTNGLEGIMCSFLMAVLKEIEP